MKQSNTSKYAYLAGLIDGEGYICVIVKTDGLGIARKNPQYSLILGIGQKNGRLIDWLYGNFGGKIRQRFIETKRIKQKSGVIYTEKSSLYIWEIGNTERIYEILKRILPFSKEKKKQIELAIRFCSRKLGMKKWEKKRGFIIYYPEIIMKNWIEFAQNIKEEIQKVKREFIPCAALETKLVEPSSEGK